MSKFKQVIYKGVLRDFTLKFDVVSTINNRKYFDYIVKSDIEKEEYINSVVEACKIRYGRPWNTDIFDLVVAEANKQLRVSGVEIQNPVAQSPSSKI